jgi:hypothetical protein
LHQTVIAAWQSPALVWCLCWSAQQIRTELQSTAVRRQAWFAGAPSSSVHSSSWTFCRLLHRDLHRLSRRGAASPKPHLGEKAGGAGSRSVKTHPELPLVPLQPPTNASPFWIIFLLVLRRADHLMIVRIINDCATKRDAQAARKQNGTGRLRTKPRFHHNTSCLCRVL